MVAEVAEHLPDAFTSGTGRAQMAQCPDDLRGSPGLVAQPMTVLLELHRRPGVIGPISRIEDILEMRGGVVEVDELDAVREHAAEECPVVARPVGNLDPLEELAPHRSSG